MRALDCRIRVVLTKPCYSSHQRAVSVNAGLLLGSVSGRLTILPCFCWDAILTGSRASARLQLEKGYFRKEDACDQKTVIEPAAVEIVECLLSRRM